MPYICALISSFQFFFLDSRPMTSHHVTYHVTTVMCLFIIKEKEKKKKRNIKSRKIDKSKEKCWCPSAPTYPTLKYICLS